SVGGGPSQRFEQLVPRYGGLRLAGLVEERLDRVEPSVAGGAGQRQRRAVLGEERGRLGSRVGEAGVDQVAVPIIGRDGAIERRAPLDQEVDERVLHAGLQRVNARRHQSERRRAAVHVAGGV